MYVCVFVRGRAQSGAATKGGRWRVELRLQQRRRGDASDDEGFFFFTVTARGAEEEVGGL
jgi:hypothetical protein